MDAIRILTGATLYLAAVADPAGAQEAPGRLKGAWGTGAQCERALIQPGGTVRADPVELDETWLRQGAMWCSLTWFELQPQDGGFYVAAQALCGEDSQRAWRLGLSYRYEMAEQLTLIWDDQLVNGPLGRCLPGKR